MGYHAEMPRRINYVGALPEYVNLKTNVIVTDLTIKNNDIRFFIVLKCVSTIFVQAKHGINNIKLISLIILVVPLARRPKNINIMATSIDCLTDALLWKEASKLRLSLQYQVPTPVFHRIRRCLSLSTAKIISVALINNRLN